MSSSSPVCGLRPFLADRYDSLKVPKPMTPTRFPADTSCAFFFRQYRTAREGTGEREVEREWVHVEGVGDAMDG